MNTQKLLMAVLAVLVENNLSVDDRLTTSLYNKLADTQDKLTPETRALLPNSYYGAMFDSSSDSLMLHVPAYYKASKAEKSDELVPAHTVTFDLPYDAISLRLFKLAFEGLQIQPDYSCSWNTDTKLTALDNYIIPVLQGQDKIETAKKAESLSLSFDFTEYGLNPAMFAGGNKSVYNLPKNGGIKVYLKPEFKRQFDDLCEEGLLDEAYGRNLVKEGEFQGFFAVVIPVKK